MSLIVHRKIRLLKEELERLKKEVKALRKQTTTLGIPNPKIRQLEDKIISHELALKMPFVLPSHEHPEIIIPKLDIDMLVRQIIEKLPRPRAPRIAGSGVKVHANEYHDPDFLSGVGTIKTTLSFAVVGTLTTGNDKAPTIVAPCALTIVKVKVVVKTAPTGASLKVDVNIDGTTIFTDQDNRPEIAIGETQDDSGTPDVTNLAEGDKVTIDIDQIGSTVAGADLTVEVVCTQSVVFS